MTVNWLQECGDNVRHFAQWHAPNAEAAEGFANGLRLLGIEFWISD